MNASKKIMNQDKTDSSKKKVSAPVGGQTLGAAGSEGPGTKGIVLGVICALIVIGICIGVGVQQFKPTTVLKIDDTKFSLDDMMYPIYEKESQYLPSNDLYQMYTQTSVWDTQYLGEDPQVSKSLSNAEGLKQEIINAETEYEVLYNTAIKEKYTLTKAEKADAKKQAKKAVKGLSWYQKVRLSISESNLTERFEKRILANRYKKDTQEAVNKTVDEKKEKESVKKEDYKQYDVDFYAFSKTSVDPQTQESKELSADEVKKLTEDMKKLKKDAKKKDADFTKLLGENKENGITFDSASILEKEGWSTYLSEDNLKKITSLKNDEISDVITDESTGYTVLVKMKNNDSSEAYDAACDEAVKNAQTQAYIAKLNEIKKNFKIKVYNKVWDTVTIGSMTTEIVTADDLTKMNEKDSSTSESK